MEGRAPGSPGTPPEEEGESDEWVPLVSGREKKGDVPLRVITRVGRGLYPGLGRMAPRRPFILLYFFLLFYFMICFNSFAYLVQNNSNKFLSYSNIHSNVLNQ
jgi:hypothetical protein